MLKKVFGVGVNDFVGKVHENNKQIKSYSVWVNMLSRCYNDKVQDKYPKYKGCKVCDEWLSFSNFKKWFDENYPFKTSEELKIKFELDKDLMKVGNKIYSPETCVFLPKKVNLFLSGDYKNNTSGYRGVYFRKNNWVCAINDFSTGEKGIWEVLKN